LEKISSQHFFFHNSITDKQIKTTRITIIIIKKKQYVGILFFAVNYNNTKNIKLYNKKLNFISILIIIVFRNLIVNIFLNMCTQTKLYMIISIYIYLWNAVLLNETFYYNSKKYVVSDEILKMFTDFFFFIV